MSATRVPSYPRSAKTSAAARSSRSRVSAAVTPAIRPITELKERSSDSSRPQLLLADGRKRGGGSGATGGVGVKPRGKRQARSWSRSGPSSGSGAGDGRHEPGGLGDRAVGGGHEAGLQDEVVPHAGPLGVGDVRPGGRGTGGRA